ncbi:putative repeat protein (TIGR03943 family) [Streptacidiphilus sp. MAP12-20]|uniref:TIGR03943 family putative permease subunit n=1 Tax=Streptacidiphilus sp. MAP12-20 TaxID=3156299 RepID=UPI0035177AC3
MRTLNALNRHRTALLLLLSGAALLRITLASDLFQRYVKQSLRPELVAAGVLLVLLGILSAVRDQPGEAHDEEARGHAGPGRLAWLLAPPALLLLSFAPPSLGAFTVARDGSGQIARPVTFDPLPPTGTLRLRLSDFDARAVWDTHQSLKGRTVEVEGFVAPGRNGTWQISRIIVSCCAADARVVAVTVLGPTAPPANTWVTVTGTWNPADATPTIEAATLARIPSPADPYRDTAP